MIGKCINMKKISLLIIVGLLTFLGITYNEPNLLYKEVYAETSSINLSQNNLTLGVNTSTILKLTVSSELSSQKINWKSSDSSIATVDSNGKVTGISLGTAYITVTVGDYKASCVVTVTNNYIEVTGITLNKTNLTLSKGSNEILKASITPSNATNKGLIWKSSDSSIAIVDQNGKVTAKSAGTAYITVSSNSSNYKSICQVTVVNTIALTKISTTASITIKEKSTKTLPIYYTPNNATNKKVTWKSSNPSIATVNSSGVVTGVSAGTATITITSNDGNHVATSKVIVEAISKELKGISLDKKELTLKPNEEANLNVTFTPTYAENKEVTWSSSNRTVATVEDGKIKALKPGTTEIKVKSKEGNFEAICKVTVTSPPIESIAFEEELITIYLGEQTTLNTISTPENSILEKPIWTSSDETIATVENGVVTPKKVGIVTITISSEDEKIKASIEVNVEEKPQEPLMITIEGYHLNFDPNKKDYSLAIGNETSLVIKTNIESNKVIINGNKDLKNGSIITITIKEEEAKTYIINISKKEDYLLYFIAIISILLLINIIRIVVKNKKSKKRG